MVSLLDADMIIAEVEKPLNLWCDCGHKAAPTFKVKEDSEEKPMRFFNIKKNDMNGIYCEMCLILANYIAKKQKEGK